jgi:hypothetical protein
MEENVIVILGKVKLITKDALSHLSKIGFKKEASNR